MTDTNYLFNVSNRTVNQIKSKQVTNTITLYYCLNTSEGVYNAADTVFKTDPEDIETFRGISNRYMTDENYNPNTDIITYVSSRTKAKIPDFPKAMYNEVLTITSLPYSDNIVQAVCNYEDAGSGFETQVNFNNFTITGASGKFIGYNNIRITYDNDNVQKTRTLIFS